MGTSVGDSGHFHGNPSSAMLADTDVNILRAIWLALETQRVPDSQPRQVSPLDMTVEFGSVPNVALGDLGYYR